MKLTDKKFSIIFLLTIFLSFFSIGIFNYLVDYENIFSKKNLMKKELRQISNNINVGKSKFINTTHRDMKRALALFSKYDDCFLFGSSQHIIISSDDINKLDPKCKKNTNLSLPGGSLEDILINTYFTTIREKKIKKIFLGLGPYTFKYNSDYQLRWKKFESVFIKMNDKKILEKKNFFDSSKEKLKILYDKKLLKKNLYYLNNVIFNSDKNSNFSNIKVNIDGSYEFIGEYKNRKGEHVNKVQDARWGFNELNFEDEPKKSLINNIKYIQSKGIEVDILIIPFHPIVFSSGDWIVSKIYDANYEINKIAKEFGLDIYGSFFPDDLGCTKFDFYDDSHVKKTCIKNIVR